jgi:hypothetical protein
MAVLPVGGGGPAVPWILSWLRIPLKRRHGHSSHALGGSELRACRVAHGHPDTRMPSVCHLPHRMAVYSLLSRHHPTARQQGLPLRRKRRTCPRPHRQLRACVMALSSRHGSSRRGSGRRGSSSRRRRRRSSPTEGALAQRRRCSSSNSDRWPSEVEQRPRRRQRLLVVAQARLAALLGSCSGRGGERTRSSRAPSRVCSSAASLRAQRRRALC